MLQFNATIGTISARYTPRLYCRFTASFATNSVVPNENVKSVVKLKHQATSRLEISDGQKIKFNELKMIVYNFLKTRSTTAFEIQNAQNMHDLLSLLKKQHLPSDEILSVKNIIMKQVKSGNENIRIQNDKNFIPLEEKVTKANLDWYSNLSTSVMIQQLYKLAQDKNRNTKVIKVLIDNIIEHNTKLNSFECSILLFSICALYYYDKRLLEKISCNLMSGRNTIYIMQSALKSMAIIRYKNTKLLDNLLCSFIKFGGKLKKTYIVNILHSLAILGYKSKKTSVFIQEVMPTLSKDLLNPNDWLNIVWSLLVLDNVLNSQIESVLQNTFIDKLNCTDINKTLQNQMKLLNINAAAKYMLKEYNGPFLDSSKVPYVTNVYNKERKLYIQALGETLTSMLEPSEFTLNLNTNMGFLLDAECTNFNYKTNVLVNNQADEDRVKKISKKIAIMLHDYQAYCQWSTDLQGVTQLQAKLLKHKGYHVLPISYVHFGLNDTLDKRVKTLRWCFDISNQV